MASLLTLALLFLSSLASVLGDKVRVWGLSAVNLRGDPLKPPDPYVKVWCGPSFGGTTDHMNDNANPNWAADFHFLEVLPKATLRLEVWDKDMMKDDRLGTCSTVITKGIHSNICNLKHGTLFYTYSYGDDDDDDDDDDCDQFWTPTVVVQDAE